VCSLSAYKRRDGSWRVECSKKDNPSHIQHLLILKDPDGGVHLIIGQKGALEECDRLIKLRAERERVHLLNLSNRKWSRARYERGYMAGLVAAKCIVRSFLKGDS